MNIVLDLPWPPTANTYWRRNGGRYFISKRGQDYREYVAKACYAYQGLFVAEDRLRVKIKAYPPDRRKRDLDNLFKSTLDSIQHAGLYVDDCQIDKLSIERMPEHEGKISIYVEKID
jgi:crossover junction endodeoxyribonuclease RusA